MYIVKDVFLSRLCSFSDIITRHCFEGLSDEQQEDVHEILTRHIQMYTKYRKVGTREGVSALIAYIEETHNLVLKAMESGSLELTLLCPSLDSLESLWRDYQSGHLNRIAERYLVTDDIKRKLNLKTVRLKTTIEDENYRNCKKILMEKSCEFDSLLKVYVAKGKFRNV